MSEAKRARCRTAKQLGIKTQEATLVINTGSHTFVDLAILELFREHLANLFIIDKWVLLLLVM
jgi:hypothetical protein